jgi:opacity protein-like surface antigen
VAEYELFGAFMVDVGLLVQPLHNSKGILGKLGIYANFRTALGLKSQANNDAELATTWYDVQFGLRQRFGGWNKHVAASLGYGIQHFEINDIDPADLDLYPQSSYGYLRVGVDGRYPLGAKLAIIGGGGVRLVLAQEGFNESIGTDKPKAFGFDVGVGATYALGKSLEARIAFDLQRYGTTLSPGASDDNPMTYEADTATEQTLGLGAGIYYSF